MATRFEMVLHGDDQAALRAAGEEAIAEIEQIENQISLYRPVSEIAHINARAALESVRVSPRVFALLEKAKMLTDQTDGAFDITIAPLVHCWGFMEGSGRLPSEDEIEEARGKVGMNLVQLNSRDSCVRFEREGVMLDLGAIGKGYAIERAAEGLREAGVASALLHGGTSTVYALGRPPDAPHWNVAIEDQGSSKTATGRDAFHRVPYLFSLAISSKGENGDAVERVPTGLDSAHGNLNPGRAGESEPPHTGCCIVPLRDEALSVSAVRGKFFEAEGKTFGHVLDPRTGRPVMGAVLAAVVLPSATETDVLSTALLVRGQEGQAKIAKLRSGIRTWVATDNGAITQL